MLSAICFNLDQSKILSGNGLNKVYLTFHRLCTGEVLTGDTDLRTGEADFFADNGCFCFIFISNMCCSRLISAISASAALLATSRRFRLFLELLDSLPVAPEKFPTFQPWSVKRELNAFAKIILMHLQKLS